MRLIEEIFCPGSTVELEFVRDDGFVARHSTRVTDLEKEYIVLQAPVLRGVTIHIEEGRELTLRKREDRYKQAYVTSVFVVENRPGRTPAVVCTKPKEIDRTSLRRYSRFNAGLDCHCRINKKIYSGQAADLSMCGARVILDQSESLEKGAVLDLTIELPDGAKLIFSGEAVRVGETGEPNKLVVAVDIREISADMHEALKNHLFHSQLML